MASLAGAGNAAAIAVIIQGEGDLAALVNRYGGTHSRLLPVIRSIAATLPPSAVTRLAAEPGVSRIWPDVQVQASGLRPRPLGDGSAPTTDYPQVVGADQVWNEGITGREVGVAVLDTGIDDIEAELTHYPSGAAGRIATRVDFTGGPEDPDPNGHGSHVAGIIANGVQDAYGI
jgi:serine protease AprX